MRGHLIIFAKEPRLGAVKTRLAREIGDAAALRFYEATVARLMARAGRVAAWRCWLAVTPDRFAGHARRVWRNLPGAVAIVPQGKGDLGARMRRVLDALPPGPAVLVGSDIPDLGRRQIESAFAALGRSDIVFGPAEDGGYWLVGEKRLRPAPDLFRNVRWSTASALADTIANIRPGLSHVLLDPLADVDDRAAYEKAASVKSKAAIAPGRRFC